VECIVEVHILHNRDSGAMEFVNHLFGRDPDSGDKECSLVLDDDVRQLRELAVGVVILLRILLDHFRLGSNTLVRSR